jgi:hypothetical protein
VVQRRTKKEFLYKSVVVRSAVELRQGIEAGSDKLWLDASARDTLGFAVMVRVSSMTQMSSNLLKIKLDERSTTS